MFKSFQLLVPLFLCLVMFSPPGFAQADDSTPAESNRADPDDNVEAPVTSSQEVEVNEDMYRQFMELKDARQQRMILPEDAFKPGSGSQTLDELPEESQKHLRNQLREIILQGGQWQPGDENTNYPYVASQAASGNPELQKKEAAAWGELLDSYHKREAQIYQNSARTRAAMASQNGQGQSGANGEGDRQNQSSGANSGGQVSPAGQTDRQRQSQQDNGPQNEIPNSAKITSSSSSAGVSQNALEFLQRNGQQGDKDNAQARTDANSSDGQLADNGTQSNSEEVAKKTVNTNSDSEMSSDPAESVDSRGTTQNALEYVIGEQPAQNNGQAPEPNATGSTGGTLSINELANAKGVGTGSKPVPSPPPPVIKKKQPPDNEPTDKDGRP